MIKINLLPVEKRKAERTPLPRFILIVLNAAALAGLILYSLGEWLNIRGYDNDIQEKTKQLADLQPQVARHDQLETSLNQLKAKIAEIDSITARDVEGGWWRAVNALWDVIQNNPKVWIDDIKALDEKAAQSEIKKFDPESKETPPYGIVIKCHAAGYEVATMTRFRNELKNNPILQETLYRVNESVDWKIDDDKDADEKFSTSFVVGLLARSKASAPAPAPAVPPAPPAAAPGGVR